VDRTADFFPATARDYCGFVAIVSFSIKFDPDLLGQNLAQIDLYLE